MWIEGGETGPVERSHYRGQRSSSQARLRPADWRMGKVGRVEQVTGWHLVFTCVCWECILQTSSGGITREWGSQAPAQGNEARTLPLEYYARGQQSPPRGGSTSLEWETKFHPIVNKLGRGLSTLASVEQVWSENQAVVSLKIGDLLSEVECLQ